MTSELPIFDVTGAVAVLNQTFEYAFPSMVIVGELSELRVSKGKWLYFDIKDASSKLKCFGTVFQIKTPLEDGMIVEVIAQPRLHNLYGFSLNVQSIRPVGEGSIKKSAKLLQEKLAKEGLFDEDRKRLLPYPPQHIALVASGDSAAYGDFMKILKSRWPYMTIDHYEVHVQGTQAETDVVRAIHAVNEQSKQPEVLVLIRGGGSTDDLSAFSTESVTRAVAASRVPTIVAIGHEVDVSLAELAADQRASTPSNAAELLVPDYTSVKESLRRRKLFLSKIIEEEIKSRRLALDQQRSYIYSSSEQWLNERLAGLHTATLRLESYHPKQVLKRGYGLIKHNDALVKDVTKLHPDDHITVELYSGEVEASVSKIVQYTKKGVK